MLGTASTQQLFASANSIGVVPQVWAEWNYNSFISPDFVTSGTGSDLITSNFNTNINDWTSSTAAIKFSSDKRTKDAFSSSSAISIKINGVGKTSIVSSPNFSLEENKFYKLVFYTKVGNLKNTTGIPNRISGSSINLTAIDPQIDYAYAFSPTFATFYIKSGMNTSSFKEGDNILVSGNSSSEFNGNFSIYSLSASTVTVVPTASTFITDHTGTGGTISSLNNNNKTNVYYYRVVPFGSNGQSPGPDTINNSDTASISVRNGLPVKISWTKSTNANQYRIYRSTSINKIMSLKTVSATESSYTDPAYSESYFNENNYFNGKIDFSAVIQNAKNQKCKIFETETGDPIITQNLIHSNMERWQKVEIVFQTKDTTTGSTQCSIDFNVSAEHLNAELLLTDFHLYNISSNDFAYSEIYPAESAFLPNRPGEALLHPLLPSSDKVIKNKTNNTIYQKPVSFLTKSTDKYYSDIYPTYQMVSSYDDKFKYYVTGDTGTKGLQAFYENYLSINKIVLKIDNSIAIPQNLEIKIKTGSLGSSTSTISITSSDINSNGIAVLYYNGTSWSTSSWTSPPQLTSEGKLQNVVSSVSSIQIVDNSSSYGIGKSKRSIDNILRIIEFSPRLEIDLTNYVDSLNIKKDLTSSQSMGLPFSYINSNSGDITFSNIPSIQSNSIYGKTTFENDTKSSAFSGLLRQGVKFTAMLKPSSYENNLKESIPLFVMYSDTWSINDLDTMNVNLYDITKSYLMGSESMFFFQKDTNVFNVISGLLDYSGFSDYDYNSLSLLPDVYGGVSGFWTDEKKTVFSALQEFLIPQQIGAYIDEYGILRFNSLAQSFNQYNSLTFTPDFAITDFPVTNIGSSSSTYISNIIPSQFSETINQKIGGIIVNYKTPVVFTSPTVEHEKKPIDYAAQLVKPSVTVAESRHEVWKDKNGTALAQIFIKSDIGISDNILFVPVGSFDKDGHIDLEGSFSDAKRAVPGHAGDLIINSEIIGYNGLEYKFFDPSNPDYTVTKIIRQNTDLEDALTEYKLYANQNISSSIQFEPTGKLTNVVRGKYNTTPQNHKIYTTASTHPMNFYSLEPGAFKFYAANSTKALAKMSPDNILYLQSGSANWSTMALAPNTSYHNFITTSIKIFTPPTAQAGYYLTSDKDKKLVSFKSYWGKSKAAKKLYSPKYYPDRGEMEFGIVFNAYNTTGTSTNGMYFFSFYKNVDANGTKNDYVFRLKKLENDGKISIIKTFDDPAGLKDLFDGEIHTISLGINDKYFYLQIDSQTQKKYVLEESLVFGSNKDCGLFIKNWQNNSKNMKIYEFYSQKKESLNIYNVFLDKYYFTSRDYLNSIINRDNYTPPDNFLYQQPKVARGLIFYDIKMDSVPVIDSAGVQIQTIVYNKTNDNVYGALADCAATDITYSQNNGSSFNRRFALAHNGPLSQGTIITSGGEGAKTQTGDDSPTLRLLGKSMYPSTEHIITRIMDKNYSQNTIQISSDWVKDSNQVEQMITNISRANSGFHIDYSARIFGNPLVQVGDFAQITYRLKRLGSDPVDNTVMPIIALVTSVTQNYKDGLENTTVNLKPMIIT